MWSAPHRGRRALRGTSGSPRTEIQDSPRLGLCFVNGATALALQADVRFADDSSVPDGHADRARTMEPYRAKPFLCRLQPVGCALPSISTDRWCSRTTEGRRGSLGRPEHVLTRPVLAPCQPALPVNENFMLVRRLFLAPRLPNPVH